MPIAGISNRWASASIGVIFTAPPTIEYSGGYAGARRRVSS
jgi:hypothetical protein